MALQSLEENRTSMLLRMTARLLLKEAGIVQSERAGERAGGAFGGFVARIAARSVANATDRADTRSWSGLPAELLVARLRLPPGYHEVELTFRGASGPESVTVPIDVTAGGVTLRSVALTGREVMDAERMRRASWNVQYSVPPSRRGGRYRQQEQVPSK